MKSGSGIGYDIPCGESIFSPITKCDKIKISVKKMWLDEYTLRIYETKVY